MSTFSSSADQECFCTYGWRSQSRLQDKYRRSRFGLLESQTESRRADGSCESTREGDGQLSLEKGTLQGVSHTRKRLSGRPTEDSCGVWKTTPTTGRSPTN